MCALILMCVVFVGGIGKMFVGGDRKKDLGRV
jgi:hypothetical protein